MLEQITPNTDLWRLSELFDTVVSFNDAISQRIDEQHIETITDYRTLVIYTAGKSIVKMNEIICLSNNGYADGALALARNLYEHFVILSFFEQKRKTEEFDKCVERYFVDNEIYRLKKYKKELEIKGLTDKVDIVENEIELKKQKFGKCIKQDYWWTGLNNSSITELSKKVCESLNEPAKSLSLLFQVDYLLACSEIHTSCFGNLNRLGDNSDINEINTSPLINGHGLPLSYAVFSFITIVGITCRVLGMEDNYNNKLNDLLAFYLEKRSEGTNA